MDTIEIVINTDISDMQRIMMWRLFRARLYWAYCALVIVGTVMVLVLQEGVFVSKAYQGVVVRSR